ncbi:tRNA epoxyqueuosine(34) reductase QueG [Acidithrix sp. C25]|uniref:tRNA epoxyqueuosine(34) reductase QueG n=1 Tax=Acidithrix sp. C25 TaxID=1671482 RepID=UPI00191BC47F|nr:tRNA epoxyqueuosine(34) reductase QueG [Acidithrix sp. C25]CAG4914278.1 unnamed protein product [Acidithrix sp. C25]
MMELYLELEAKSLELGLIGFGVAPIRRFRNVLVMLKDRKEIGLADSMEFTYRNPKRSTDPSAILDGARSMVTLGLSYYPSTEIAIEFSSPIAKYARSDFYSILRDRLETLAKLIRSKGFKAVVVMDSNALVDKEAAVRSGSGIYLKNSLLSIQGHGSFVVIGTIITDAEIERSPKRSRITGCGSCTSCIQACPTSAIGPNGTIDARLCISWVLQRPGGIDPALRSRIGVRIYGCDICQDVCPYNAKLKANEPHLDEVVSDLIAILGLGDQELLERFSHLYIYKRDVNTLRRNALVGLGNSKALQLQEFHRVLEVLRNYCESDDLILVEHAKWALDQLT